MAPSPWCSDLLSKLFVGTALVVYLDWPRGRRWQLHLGLIALGVLVKTSAVILVPLLFALALLYERRVNVKAAARAALPAFVVGPPPSSSSSR